MTKPNKIRQSLKVVTAKQSNKKHETVVQLALAKSTNKNFVAFCQKTLCLKPECTGFDKSCIDVLIKHEKISLHICNECAGKKRQHDYKN